MEPTPRPGMIRTTRTPWISYRRGPRSPGSSARQSGTKSSDLATNTILRSAGSRTLVRVSVPLSLTVSERATWALWGRTWLELLSAALPRCTSCGGTLGALWRCGAPSLPFLVPAQRVTQPWRIRKFSPTLQLFLRLPTFWWALLGVWFFVPKPAHKSLTGSFFVPWIDLVDCFRVRLNMHNGNLQNLSLLFHAYFVQGSALLGTSEVPRCASLSQMC
ncbi:hypothetical protein BU26DRAFT_315453 [Trematosphaeria pertusa]|uniref:Uncharacterized protein n=1 Tax=Trematosphaeria pertusa TaxID=390896 RepID=A0A6A6IGV0_9PLEO|nr:uncharacterized protein BU26DRAFT_315453 [Trematosphaeria pertusa]KAF2249258.1 hypothetical protein BU26DRAFT_315453 [Trematosphaeria pertusa]